MSAKNPEFLRQFNAARVLLPILLGLGVVAYVLYAELIKEGASIRELLERTAWTPRSLLSIALAFLMVVIRDLGYMWQLRVLTDKRLSWGACCEVILLWDFFAAVSPSLVGGAAIAVYMLIKENLSIGRSTAIVFTSIFLDQVFYTSIPFMVSLFIPQDDLFAPLHDMRSELLGTSMMAAFWSAWGGLMVYLVLLVAALFVAPGWINALLKKFMLLPWLRRWRSRGLHMANDLWIASCDLRKRSTSFWLQVWAATTIAWLGRYLILNCVVMGFSPSPMGLFDHLLMFGRQAILWIVMVLSPTPGGAGVAELGFSWLLRDFIPAGAALLLAILWRLVSYYPYLILGIPVMTRWIRRVYGRDIRQPRLKIRRS